MLWALEEMQLPFEIVGMDHPAHDLNAESYRPLSPFEQIPALDDDGLLLSESGAILLHLAKKSGQLMPADAAGQAQVLRWSFAALNTVELPLLSLIVLDWTSQGECQSHREFLLGWCQRALGNLARWMDGRTYVATDEFTVADILMAHVLKSGIKDEALIEPHPSLTAYRECCLARPAWQRTFDAYCERVKAG